MKQRLAILGSTGSIGVQTLDIARENPGRFEVRVLTANRNWERLARQAREFDADAAVIADKQHYAQLRDALAGTDTKVYAGEEAVAQVAAGGDTDVAVNALVGYAGLAPTVAALGAGKKLALANKESLVVGGEYVMRLAAEKRAPILPIDSEHSAIFQCLAGEQSPVRRLIITCSGGALRDLKREELAGVTAEQALRHPQWEMGAKITIDSSTLVNKGFEVIEALAEIFHVDMNYLLGYTDKIEKPAGDETDPATNKFLAVTLAEIDLIEAYRHAGAETQAAIRAILHI